MEKYREISLIFPILQLHILTEGIDLFYHLE